MSETLEHELIEFSYTENGIAELEKNYLPLSIANMNDAEGIKLVSVAKKDIVKKRNNIDKKRKELTADALKLQKRINAEAKKVLEPIARIEKHLDDQLAKVEIEREEMRMKAEREALALYEHRCEKLYALEFRFRNGFYRTEYVDGFYQQPIEAGVLSLKQMSEKEFSEFYDNAKHNFDIELHRREIAAKERAAADERLKLEREEIARKQKEQDEIAKQQAEMAAKLKAQQDALDAAQKSPVETQHFDSPSDDEILMPVMSPPSNITKPDDKIEFAISFNFQVTKQDIIQAAALEAVVLSNDDLFQIATLLDEWKAGIAEETAFNALSLFLSRNRERFYGKANV